MPKLAPAPLIWLLIGDKLGDNAQAQVLADALGWPYAVRQVFPKPEWVLGKPPFVPGLDHLDLARSDRLAPPWPDLILTIGRRPSMAALWVQDQSGGRTEIVLVGRPKRWAERFALIVAPSQFQIPPRDNLVAARPAADAGRPGGGRGRRRRPGASAWRSLPRPLTAVLVGGETKPFRFDAAVAATLLARACARMQARDGGTLYLTTSRRTRPEVVDGAGRRAAARRRCSTAGPRTAGDDNPYLGLLGLRRPLRRHRRQRLDDGRGGEPRQTAGDLCAAGRARASPIGCGQGWRPHRHGGTARPLAHLLHRLGIAGYARDLGEIRRL